MSLKWYRLLRDSFSRSPLVRVYSGLMCLPLQAWKICKISLSFGISCLRPSQTSSNYSIYCTNLYILNYKFSIPQSQQLNLTMLPGTSLSKSEAESKESNSSSGAFVSTTSPVKINDQGPLFSESDVIRRPLHSSQGHGDIGVSVPIRKISSGKKDRTQPLEEPHPQSSLPRNSPRKQVHNNIAVDPTEQLRLINNYSITQSIRNVRPLTEQQSLKVISNYTFYLKDREKTSQYTQLKQKNPCLKIGVVKGAESAKQIKDFFCGLIENFSHQQHINPIAALDILEMYMNDNYARYAKGNLAKELVSMGALIKNEGGDSHINLENSFVSQILKMMETMLSDQMKQLLTIFSVAHKTDYQLFKSKAEIQSACQNLWDSFVYYYMTSPLKHQQEMEDIIRILVTLTYSSQNELTSSFVSSVLEVADECYTKQYVTKSLLMHLVIRLLRLDVINYILKGVQVDSRHNIFEQRNKNVRNLVCKLSSFQMLPFKVILPTIDKSFNSQAGLTPLAANSKTLSFGESGKEEVLEGCHWLDWVELWLEQQMHPTDSGIIMVLKCLKNCFQKDFNTFWESSGSKRFINIKLFLKHAFDSGFQVEVLYLAELLAGNPANNLCSEVYELMLLSNILTRSFIFKSMEESLGETSSLSSSGISCVKYICKLITLDGLLSRRIEKDIFEGEREGAITTYLLNTLNVTENEGVIVHILRALNNLLVTMKVLTLQKIKEFEERNYNHTCLRFMEEKHKVIKTNRSLLQSACDHLNLIVAEGETVKILGERSKWLNSFRALEPWKIHLTSFTVRCITFLVKDYGVNPNSFWSSAFRNINATEILGFVLLHQCTRYESYEVFENSIICKFLKDPGSPREVADIEVLAQTLTLIYESLVVLDRYNVSSYVPGLPSIIDAVLYKLVFNANNERFTESQWEVKKQVHPFLALIYLLCLPESVSRLIQQTAFVNVHELSIKIINRIMSIYTRKEASEPKRNSLLYNLLRQRRGDNSLDRESVDDFGRLVKSLSQKIKSRYMTETIIELMILLLRVEKLLLKELLASLKTELMDLFTWICLENDLSIHSRLLVFLVNLTQQHKIYKDFLKYILSNSALLISLNRPIQLGKNYFNHSLGEEMKKLADGERVDRDFLKEHIIRLTSISNLCQLLMAITSSQLTVIDRESIFKLFFELYSEVNVFILFNSQPNFNLALLQAENKFYKYVPSGASHSLNQIVSSMKSTDPDEYSLFKTAIDANSIAYNNWSKLFMLIINPSKSLDATRQLTSIMDFDKVLSNFVMLVLQRLNAEHITHPVFAHYMVGLSMLILGQSSRSLTNEVARNPRWLSYSGLEMKKSVFFAIEAMSKTSPLNKDFKDILDRVVSQDRCISPELLNVTSNKKDPQLLFKALNQLLVSSDNITNFTSAMHYINFNLIIKDKDQVEVSALQIMSTLCEVVDGLRVSLDQLPFYTRQSRDKSHMVWCWCLATARNLVSHVVVRGSAFNNLVIRRAETIMREVERHSDGVILTRAFKEELELISGYFAALLINKHSVESSQSVQTVNLLWRTCISLITQLKQVPITDFEKTLSQTLQVNTSGGLYSYRSTTPTVHSRGEESVRSMSLGRMESMMSQKGLSNTNKRDVTASELLEEMSTFDILFNLLCFIKEDIDNSPLYFKSVIEWRFFEETLISSFNRVFEFFQRTYGVMGVKDLIVSLNTSLNERRAFEDTGYLNTLKEQLSIEKIAEVAKANITLICAILLSHLGKLVQIGRTRPVQQHLDSLTAKIERVSQTLSKSTHLSSNANMLKEGLRAIGMSQNSYYNIVPSEGRFLGQLVRKMHL